METEDGYEALEKRGSIDLLGSTSSIVTATEPTNIVWENRQYSGMNRAIRALIVSFIICLALFVVFVFIFLVKIKIKNLSIKYEDANCSQIEQVYDEPGLMQNLSVEAWYSYYMPTG